MTVAVGDVAPDFTLKDQNNEDVTLSSFRGKQPVAIVFYPFTFTGLCQSELCEIRDDPSVFESAVVQVLAISNDSRHAQQKWAQEQGFTFPVLSDFWPHGAVSKAYGVFNEQNGAATRSTLLVDKDGKVAAVVSSPNLGTPRAREEYAAAVSGLT